MTITRSLDRLAALLASLALLMSCSDTSTSQPAVPQAAHGKDVRVVLLMLDGVRKRELFGQPEPARVRAELERLARAEPDSRNNSATSRADRAAERMAADRMIFAKLHDRAIESALVYGRPESDSFFYSANAVMKSLPAYQSIFTGFGTPCLSNSCGTVERETFFTRLGRVVPRPRTAVIASWATIPEAVEQKSAGALVNAGPGWFPEYSPVHSALNKKYGSVKYWGAARADTQTFAHGIAYLRETKPDFLFLSLNDADEWAHLNRYSDYLESLRAYDGYIEQVLLELARMPGRNWLFITTDHDRGQGSRWTNHGYEMSAASVWLLVFGPIGRDFPGPIPVRDARALPPRNSVGPSVRTHLDLRPTIETLFGITPQACPLCGSPLPEVLERAGLSDGGARP